MRSAFYDSQSYRAKQGEIARRNHEKGIYIGNKRVVLRICEREGCSFIFEVQRASTKRYCGNSCAASVSNSRRHLSIETRNRISEKLRGTESPFKGRVLVPRVSSVCSDPTCKKIFIYERYRTRKFCSRKCAFRVVNSQPTSAKASRGKAGIRPDIHPEYFFHSRWEANVARVYSHLGVTWLYEPKTFDIGNHTYTPDFYLPGENAYIEVKNFWSDFSRNRDSRFRKAYPEIVLKVILRAEYLRLEAKYANLIPLWEYNNSPAPES